MLCPLWQSLSWESRKVHFLNKKLNTEKKNQRNETNCSFIKYIPPNINTSVTVKLELKFMMRRRTTRKTNLMIVDILKLYETNVETDFT